MTGTRIIWGRQPARALPLVLAGVVSTLGLAGTSYAAGHSHHDHDHATPSVCGRLPADARFAAESRRLGREHACEHLAERLDAKGSTSLLDLAGTAVRSRVAVAEASARLANTNPAVIGRWSAARNPGTETIGITSVVLRTGKVLLFGQETSGTPTTAYLYDPVTGTGHDVSPPAPIFCGSVTPLSDGRILSVGGADPNPRGIEDVWLFAPQTERWIRQPDTPLGRYYPTSTRLAGGRVVVTAGTQTDGSTRNPTVEVYTPPAAGGSVGTLSVVGEHSTSVYPHQLVMPDGRMLQVDRTGTYVLNPSTWNWASLLSQRVNTGDGAAHLMLPGGPAGSNRVMMIGGRHTGATQAITQQFDYANPAQGWRMGPPMPTARAHMNVVQVPDGSAYAIGGNSSGLRNSPRRQTMHYDPATRRWTNLALQAPRRAYHSTAVLLPDGRIMSAGDNGVGGGAQLIDFYSPPYLFEGTRPRIAAAPRKVSFTQRFAIRTSGPKATNAVLMAPAATTHANEMNARHVRLDVRSTSTGLVATAPRANVAPPGYYMLFVLRSGVPSVARWIQIGRAGT